MKRIKIEHRSDKHDERENHDNATDNLINNDNAAVIKLVPNLVDKPCQPEPPKQRAADDAEIAYAHVQRMLGYDERKLGERCHEKEYDKRI